MKAARSGTLLAGVLALALALRLIGLDHSLPFRYVPDTHVVRGALGMAQEKSLAPPGGKYTTYPYLLPIALLPFYAGQYALGKAAGWYADAQDFGRKMVDDPTPLYRIARWLLTAVGVLGAWFAYRVTRRLGSRRAAWLAAWLFATSLLLVHLGKDIRPWGVLATLVLFCADRCLAFVERPTALRALAMGLVAGLAAATHQTGAAAALLPASAVIAHALNARGARHAAFLRAGALCGAAFVVATLLIGYPYVLRGAAGADEGIVDPSGRAGAFDLGGQSMGGDFGFARVKEIGLGFVSYEPALLLLVAAGFALGARLRPARGRRWVALLYPAVILAVFLFYEGGHTRYLTTAVPFLCVLGGVAADRLLAQRGAWRAIAALLLVFPLVQAARLDWVMTRPDTRTEFLAAIAAKVPADSTIAVEGYGPPLRFSPRAVELLGRYGEFASRSEQQEASGITPIDAGRPPYAVVPLERFYMYASAWPQQWSHAPAGTSGAAAEKPIGDFLDEVGARYLVTVDRNPGAPRNSALDALVAERGESLAQLLPYVGDPPLAAEARLPMDPDLPGLAIWGVDRPGPALQLWRLRGR